MGRKNYILLGVGAVLAIALVIYLLSESPSEKVLHPNMPPASVILIPGYGGGAESLTGIADSLEQKGIHTEILDTGDEQGDLNIYADLLAKKTSELSKTGSVGWVGYSAGGVVARLAFDKPGSENVSRVVTLGSPHAGTKVASLAALAGQCDTACTQLVPDSDVLKSLADVSDTGTLWFSIFSPSDEIIKPYTSSKLAEASNVYNLDLETCNKNVGHGELPTDPTVLPLVTNFFVDKAPQTTC